MVAKGVIVVAALMVMARRSLALTCHECHEYINGTIISPPSWCGPTPTCSYGLTKDVCRCCDVCAKMEERMKLIPPNGKADQEHINPISLIRHSHVEEDKPNEQAPPFDLLDQTFLTEIGNSDLSISTTERRDGNLSPRNQVGPSGLVFPSVQNKPVVINSTFVLSDDDSQVKQGYSCSDLILQGMKKSDTYYIKIRGTTSWFLKVYCDMQTSGGGWTVIQRRDDYGEPRENFIRDWNAYKHGFGNSNEEFWLGNENIHMLTNTQDYVLRIELEDFDGNKRYAEYSTFKLHGENEMYKLEIGGYNGNAGDSLNDPWYGSNLSPFSTYNSDNDRSSLNCASMLKAGWWWRSCGRGLNGLYLTDPNDLYSRQGIVWFRWRGWDYSLKKAVMMIRPKDYNLCVSPYFLVGEECFRISSNEKDWDSAYLECQLEGSSLAAPEDLDLLRQHLIDSGDTADYWIGGNDKDGTWKWITGDPVQEEWQKGQPSGSSGEDCLDFRVGQWPSLSDYFCLETQKYLCERPLTRTVLPNLEPVQCSSGDGIKVGQKCLAISEDPLNWHEAVTNCTNDGGKLVSLHDKTDPQMFHDFFRHYGATEFWLGGSDIANEGQWVWMNGQPIQEVFPWHPEEPNNAGRNEDCMLWRGHSSDFSDALCKKRYGYICELDASPTAAQTSGTEPETTVKVSATVTPLDDVSPITP